MEGRFDYVLRIGFMLFIIIIIDLIHVSLQRAIKDNMINFVS
jgi:hypothetical protein